MITENDRRTVINHNFIKGHEYEVVVRAVGPDGTVQSLEDAARQTIMIMGKETAPDKPITLTASGFIESITLEWTNPADYDFDHMEIWRSDTQYLTDADKIAESKGITYVDAIGAANITRYYWIRAVNRSGVMSAFYPGVSAGISATTLGVATTSIDDFAVTATKLYTNTIVLTGDVWSNNSPGAGSIAWNEHYLVYGGAYYKVGAGSTSSRYVYWDVGHTGGSGTVADPYLTTYTTNASYAHAANRFVVVTNESGVVQKVWNASANMVIGTAFILDAAITNAKIYDCNVNKLTAGTISSKSIVLAVAAGTGDVEIRAGIASGDFANTSANTGFIFGLDDSDSDKPKAYFGSPTQYWKWDGTNMTISGVITVQAGSNVEAGADVTSTHTAAAISGQGALATQDTVGASDCDVTIISGGKIITELLTADNIQAGTLTARTVQTASSGYRMVLDASGNYLTGYNASNVQTTKLDSDSAGVLWIGDSANTRSYLWNNSLELKTAEAATSTAQLYLNNDYNNQLNMFYIDSVTQVSPTLSYLIKAYVNSTPVFTLRSDGYAYFSDSIGMVAGKTVDGIDVSAHNHGGAGGATVSFSSLGSTPTTLAGYGITDAAPSSHVGAGGAAHADVIAGGDDGFMTGADKTKLNGIETAADVTDATNVAAAGAIMDGDFTGNGFMKRTGAGAYTYQADGLTAAGLSFTTVEGIHTVVITNGIIVSWTIA